MISFNPENLEPVLEEAADTFILPRFQMLQDHEISSKTNPTDLVTLADIEAEQFLEKVLPDLLPGSVVIGEESVSREDKSLDALADKDQTIWVVDPVDGTYNFVHGRVHFGIMVALVYKGENIGGWIYDVLNKTLVYSMKGEGVYDAGKRVQFKGAQNLKASEMDIHLSPKFFPAKIRDDIKARRKDFRTSHPIGCSAHEYLNILRQKRLACVYCRLKPWDHLPGTLMVSEAGGYVQKWDNTPYTPQDVYGGLIAAQSKEQWQTIYETLFRGIDLAALKKRA